MLSHINASTFTTIPLLYNKYTHTHIHTHDFMFTPNALTSTLNSLTFT